MQWLSEKCMLQPNNVVHLNEELEETLQPILRDEPEDKADRLCAQRSLELTGNPLISLFINALTRPCILHTL